MSISLGNALPQMDTESRRSLFMSVLNYSFFPLIYYPSVGLGISWLFFQKLKHHKSMLHALAQTTAGFFKFSFGDGFANVSHKGNGLTFVLLDFSRFLS